MLIRNTVWFNNVHFKRACPKGVWALPTLCCGDSRGLHVSVSYGFGPIQIGRYHDIRGGNELEEQGMAGQAERTT